MDVVLLARYNGDGNAAKFLHHSILFVVKDVAMDIISQIIINNVMMEIVLIMMAAMVYV